MTTSKTGRRPFGIRWWHKWVGIVIGILLIAWTVSGVVMLIPRSSVSSAGQGTGAAVDWAAVAVSPARAAQLLPVSTAAPPSRLISNGSATPWCMWCVLKEAGRYSWTRAPA